MTRNNSKDMLDGFEQLDLARQLSKEIKQLKQQLEMSNSILKEMEIGNWRDAFTGEQSNGYYISGENRMFSKEEYEWVKELKEKWKLKQ